MGKHQLDKVAAKLLAGPWPVVTADEIGALGGFKPGDRRSYGLIRRLKIVKVIEPRQVRSTYFVAGREKRDVDIFRAWLRLHPGQGAIEEVQMDDQRRRSVSA
jgi:hypothetical protein